jgi:hypothetical protein
MQAMHCSGRPSAAAVTCEYIESGSSTALPDFSRIYLMPRAFYEGTPGDGIVRLTKKDITCAARLIRLKNHGRKYNNNIYRSWILDLDWCWIQ